MHVGDVCDYPFLLSVFKSFAPEAVVHYAEQPAAPYSMRGHREAVFAITNNLISTANLVHAVKENNLQCHILKLGAMGVYGTPNIDIEEGYLEVDYKGRKHTFLYPKAPGSLYHLTKVQDGDMLYFYCRMWGIRVTDLNQGPVYGLDTEESRQDRRLLPIFNYDDIFGTVLNRFLVQAVAGVPLTVYGRGGRSGATSTSSTPSPAWTWPSANPPPPANTGCSTSSWRPSALTIWLPGCRPRAGIWVWTWKSRAFPTPAWRPRNITTTLPTRGSSPWVCSRTT